MSDFKTIKTENNNSIIYDDKEEYFYIDNTLLLYFNRKTSYILDYRYNLTGIPITDNNIKAEILLEAHLQHFTTDGLNPDEFILILDNHPYYKDIQYQKNLVTIDAENINKIKKPKNRDFEMFPIFAEGEDCNHWLTGIIQFNEDGKQIGYYTFDSDMTKNNDSIVNINNDNRLNSCKRNRCKSKNYGYHTYKRSS